LHSPSSPPQPRPPAHFTTKRIEDIRVGERVLTNKQRDTQSAETKVDPATWRLVKLLAFQRWADGTLDDIHIETLQPPEWLTQTDVRVGAEVPLRLDLVEMGLPDDLRGEVLAVEDCPAIAPGPGRVVLTTVNHLNSYVLELTVEDGHDKQEKIRPTGFHKFYRPRDNQWVSAHDLQVGDHLQGQQGLLRVVATMRIAGVHRVYNLTVEGEHLYRVSSLGVLVHNNGCGPYSHLSDSTKVEPGRAFQPKQKAKILEENQKNNNGVLRSDNPLDPWYGKELVAPSKGPFKPGEYPSVPLNQAQVDHIVPRLALDGSPRGTNSYGNAQVISFEYNNMLKNNK
jgi:hypothetical protein